MDIDFFGNKSNHLLNQVIVHLSNPPLIEIILRYGLWGCRISLFVVEG